MDTAPLHDAFRALQETPAGVAAPPPGEWDADHVWAHVSLITGAAVEAAAALMAGSHPHYDSRLSHDSWTLDHVVAVAGDPAGLRERVRRQGEALCALAAALSDTERDTPVPTLLVADGKVMYDKPLTLREILTGLATVELPGHASQLTALVPA
ncbi:hypothetical protein GCM10010172_81300 [Paractinoplanes ferrugineus]|uniref:Uncharacterized protein n=1 Tax=Paractinoplanes ferrugineus TaxID=113564 RepID=A0A919IWP7_9ACTN|nr:hypothetical protein [Actinoplanes ferrugineus]GIE10451.1 hypothetical protein Afe05nite_22910 [Actinoplanes ferrugineus]